MTSDEQALFDHFRQAFAAADRGGGSELVAIHAALAAQLGMSPQRLDVAAERLVNTGLIKRVGDDVYQLTIAGVGRAHRK